MVKYDIKTALKIVADLNSLQIIEFLREQPKGYNQLQRELGNISPTTLSLRLKNLKKIGMLEHQSKSIGSASTYSITEKGKMALPIIDEIRKFVAIFE